MQASPGFICDRRTRCKHCSGKPEYITNLVGVTYHNPEWNHGRGSHRGQYDKQTYRLRDEKEYDYNKLMRENSLRGVAAFSAYIVKKQKDQWGSYRQMISCKCGESRWMYPGPTADMSMLSRKKIVTIDHYRHRRNLDNVIGYTW